MKKGSSLFNGTIALVFLVLWGNLIRLLLPAEQNGVILKTLDYALLLYVVAAIGFLMGKVLNRRRKKDPGKE